MEPATEKPPAPVREFACECWDTLKACSAPGGRENPLPSWSVTIRMPGLRGGGGGAVFASEAALDERLVLLTRNKALNAVPIPLGSFSAGATVVGVVAPDLAASGVSGVENREKVPPRWVSLSSAADQYSLCRRLLPAILLVIFQDMLDGCVIAGRRTPPDRSCEEVLG